MALEQLTVTCPHCSGTFVVKMNIGKSQNGSTPKQHSPGCMKTVWLLFKQGKFSGTK